MAGDSMATNFVLIDLENTQPENLDRLVGKQFKVYVFMGEHQKKVSTDILLALKNLGENWDCIQMAGNGPNALDFHIAYYLGKLAKENPDGHFFIVSRDKGFDPLVRHIAAEAQGAIKVRRIKDLDALPMLRPAPAKTPKPKPKPTPTPTPTPDDLEAKLDAVVRNFAARGSSLPRSSKTLANTINVIFKKKLPKWEILALVNELKARQIIHAEGKRLEYALPRATPDGNGKPAEIQGKPAEKERTHEYRGEQLLFGDHAL